MVIFWKVGLDRTSDRRPSTICSAGIRLTSAVNSFVSRWYPARLAANRDYACSEAWQPVPPARLRKAGNFGVNGISSGITARKSKHLDASRRSRRIAKAALLISLATAAGRSLNGRLEKHHQQKAKGLKGLARENSVADCLEK